MAIFIYILYFLVLFIFNYKKYGFNPSSFLIIIYLFSSFCGGILLFGYDTFDIEKVKFFPVIYHIICLTLFLNPLIVYFNAFNISTIKNQSQRFYKYLTIITISFCSLSLIYRIPRVISSFSGGDIVASRKMVYEGENVEAAGNIFEYIGVFGHFFYPVAMLLFFVNISREHNKRNIYLIVILLLCSFSEVLQGLSLMGRGGLMRWALLFSFLFLLFRPILEKNIIKSFRKWSLIILSPIIFVFYLISSARFSERTDGLIFSLLDYAGQSFIYFSYNFETFFDNTFGGRQVFPILFPSDEGVSMTGMNSVIYAPYNLNTFSTFVGSFYLDVGFLITILIALAFYLFHKINYDLSKRKNSIVKLSIYLIYTQIIMNGFLYYMYYSPMAIKSFIMVQVIIFVLHLNFRKKVSI